MELWEQLAQENDRFHERMESYEDLPVEERIDKYREEIREAERRILEITGDPYDGYVFKTCDSDDKRDTVESLLGLRYFALSKMFKIHCSDAEVARIESLNAKLLELTRQMFKRTGSFYRYILDMPLEEKDDDIEIEGSLRYWDDEKSGILHLEDDEFYGSDFQRMIPIIAFIEREHHGDLAIVNCSPSWERDSDHRSSMNDNELGIEDFYDDGDTWAEGWLRHPKLDHIVMCYATHAIVTHNDFSIPDFMRLNDFEVKVEMKLQQFSEQDGSRMRWWEQCGERQFIDKFLHEAEHRPSGMSLGEFVYTRGIEYFNIEEWDEGDRISLQKLLDCRKDDSRAEEFLKELYRMVAEKQN